MPREDWRDLEADRLRRLRDRDRDRDDYGQADYSDLYGYDPVHRTGYRAYDDGRREPDDYDGRRPFTERRAFDEHRTYDHRRGHDDRRSFDDRRGYEDRRNDDSDYDIERRRTRRAGPSDRVLWAVIMERLEDERRLDLRDVDVDVRDGDVILNGTVRHKTDKRRIEDVADIDGVRNVLNNLRVQERRRWTLF